jgi:ABC-type multidrug transport system fused ATPase/permease subunit
VSAPAVSARPRSAGPFARGLRVVASYVRTHPLVFGIAVGSAAVYAAATVASAIVLGRVTDQVLAPAFSGHGTARAAILGAVAVAGVAVVRAWGIVFRRYFAGMTASRMERTLRNQVVDRYRELPLSYHRSRPAGELIAHTESDVLAATNVLHPIPYSTAVVLLVVFATVSLILTDSFLAVIGFFVLPLLAVLNRFYGGLVEPALTRAQEHVGDVSAVAHESVDGALVVKTLGREAAELERLAKVASKLRDERITVGRIRANFEPAFDGLPVLGSVILLAVGSWRVSTGHITTGTLVQFLSLFQLLSWPIRLLGFVLVDIPRAVVGRERLDLVLLADAEPRPDTLEDGAGAPHGPVGVSLENVDFAYGESQVLHGVTFSARAGETVAVVGPTGSGKSTLLELLVGLEKPARGEVRVGGVLLSDLPRAEARRLVSIVFQESFLFGDSIRANITLGEEIPDEDVRRAARLAQADGFVGELEGGYDAVVGERGVTLSGGQRQRVALARALVRQPRVLILDDATSAVDPHVEAAILDGLRREVSCTLLVVAHRTSTIDLADRIVVLDEGRVVAAGTRAEVAGNPTFDAIVRAYQQDPPKQVPDDGGAAGRRVREPQRARR